MRECRFPQATSQKKEMELKQISSQAVKKLNKLKKKKSVDKSALKRAKDDAGIALRNHSLAAQELAAVEAANPEAVRAQRCPVHKSNRRSTLRHR